MIWSLQLQSFAEFHQNSIISLNVIKPN